MVPMTPLRLLDDVIRPALLAPYLPVAFDTREARAMLLAWALQVEGCTCGTGPWCFDKKAILRVTLNPAVDDLAAEVARDAKIRCAAHDLGRRLDGDPVLACRLARLALAADESHTLPALHQASVDQAWQCYLRVTRPSIADDPGSEDYRQAHLRWEASWGRALETLG